MTVATLQRLYPSPCTELPLAGAYLGEALHRLGSVRRPLAYANFVSSLDGRIALMAEAREPEVPAALTTASDWLLFRELQAQADCLITHGGYLRQLAAGTLDDILRVGTRADDAHLLDWRREQGLAPQPAIVIASASLDFPLPPGLPDPARPLYLATGAAADPARVGAWRRRGLEVIRAGAAAGVEGRPLLAALGERGYRSLYLQTGPLMLETMLRDGVLSRLYLTLGHRLLGGERFHTLLRGALLGAAGRVELRSLYFEPGSEAAAGQFFACFEQPGAPR